MNDDTPGVDGLDVDSLNWFTSSATGDQGACVEVAHLSGGGVAVRDTKDRSKAPHIYTNREWDAFLFGVKNGEFDRPAL